jgi:hypothetical protein
MYGYSIEYRLLCMVIQLNIKRIIYGSIKCCVFMSKKKKKLKVVYSN